MPIMTLHRRGRKFQDDGKTLLYEPDRQEWNGEYMYQKQGSPLRIRKNIRSSLEYFKEDYPTKFKGLAESITIELVKYLTLVNGGEPVELSSVYQEGAYLLKVSPETVKRYVVAHTAMNAELYRIGKKVRQNPRFKQAEDEEEDDA